MNQPADPHDPVSRVLRLKRQERPSAEFWDNFDAEFRQRQLRALTRLGSTPPRWSALPQRFLTTLPTLGVVGACALLAFATVRMPEPAGEPAAPSIAVVLSPEVPEAETPAQYLAPARSGVVVPVAAPPPRFVVDRFGPDAVAPVHFRRELLSSALRAPERDSTRYVQDALQPTTAVLPASLSVAGGF